MPWLVLFKPIVDRIPTPKSDPETVKRKLGLLGEPMVMGLVIGFILALLAGVGPVDIAKISITSAAVLELLPRMIGILMEGLRAIADSIVGFMKSHYPKRELYIGMDAAIAIGHPTTISVGLILIPIVLIMAILIPTITVLPYADLAALMFFVVAVVPFFRGDMVKSLITGSLVMLVFLHLGSWWSPIFTKTAIEIGALAPGAAPIGCIWLQPMIPVAVIASGLGIMLGMLSMAAIIVLFLFVDRIGAIRKFFSKLYK